MSTRAVTLTTTTLIGPDGLASVIVDVNGCSVVLTPADACRFRNMMSNRIAECQEIARKQSTSPDFARLVLSPAEGRC